MVVADTSAWVDFLAGRNTKSAECLEHYLEQGLVVLPEPVLFELLSSPGLKRKEEQLFREVPRLNVVEGLWERAGESRRSLLKKGRKARAVDCLISQICIDTGVPIITFDQDFRHFAGLGLKLVVPLK